MVYFNSLFLLVVATGLVQESCGIQCFVCRSDKDSNCEDSYDSPTEHVVNCSTWQKNVIQPLGVKASLTSGCRKIHQKVRGEVVTMRECIVHPLISNPCNITTTDHSVEECSVCYTDNCNGAPARLMQFSLSSLLFIAATVCKAKDTL